MIQFIFEFEGSSIILPINPSNFEWSREGTNENAEVLGLGQIVIPGGFNLATSTIESYFPGLNTISPENYSLSNTFINPHEYRDIFLEMWGSKKPIKLTITNMNQNSLLILISNFRWDRRAGEHEDLYYSLEIVEYIPYGAVEIKIKDSAQATAKPISPQRSNENKPLVGRTYTVVKGDSLWAITKKKTGNGNNWRQLYEANKQIVGNNPNLIYPGQVLKIPEGWVS